MFEGLFQPLHLLIILLIALIFFGPGKLPELGASLGKSIRDFKKAMAEGENEIKAGGAGGNAKDPEDPGRSGGSGKTA